MCSFTLSLSLIVLLELLLKNILALNFLGIIFSFVGSSKGVPIILENLTANPTNLHNYSYFQVGICFHFYFDWSGDEIDLAIWKGLHIGFALQIDNIGRVQGHVCVYLSHPCNCNPERTLNLLHPLVLFSLWICKFHHAMYNSFRLEDCWLWEFQICMDECRGGMCWWDSKAADLEWNGLSYDG